MEGPSQQRPRTGQSMPTNCQPRIATILSRSLGVNSRLDAIQAAILQVKLKHLDTTLTTPTAAQYDDVFSFDWIIPQAAPLLQHSFHQYLRMDTALESGYHCSEAKLHTISTTPYLYKSRRPWQAFLTMPKYRGDMLQFLHYQCILSQP